MLYLDSRFGRRARKRGERGAMVCVEPGRGEKRNGAGAVGGARAIAVPRSSSSVMGCMIYVVDVPLMVRPFSTAAPFHSFQRARATTEAPFRARDR